MRSTAGEYVQPPRQLAPTPPMGWMSWNAFGHDLTEEVVLDNAEALVRTGLHERGYEYVCLDDHWHGPRSADGRLRSHPDRFPHGIAWLAAQIHDRGLKLGIYTCAGPMTCGGEPGSEGWEEIDGQTFVEWGVDYVKDDYCHAPVEREAAIERYTRMGAALAAMEREVVFAVCEWGERKPWEWAPSVGAQLWRSGPDIRDSWDGGGGIISAADQCEPLGEYAGPGRWNDPDMLVVGLRGRSREEAAGTVGCTDHEYRTQMTLWAMLAAPLFVSCDLRAVDPATLALLSAPGVLAIDQDGDGLPGRRIERIGPIDVWQRSLKGGDTALALVNRSDEPMSVELEWESHRGAAPDIVDAWTDQPVQAVSRVGLAPHASVLYRGPDEAVNPRRLRWLQADQTYTWRATCIPRTTGGGSMESNIQEPTEHERKVADEEARESGREPDEPEAEDWRRESGVDASSEYETEIEAERRGTDAEHIEDEESEKEPFTTGRFPSEPTR